MKPLDLDVIAVVDTQVKPLLVGCQLIHGRLSTSVFSRARTFKPVLVLKHSQLILDWVLGRIGLTTCCDRTIFSQSFILKPQLVYI